MDKPKPQNQGGYTPPVTDFSASQPPVTGQGPSVEFGTGTKLLGYILGVLSLLAGIYLLGDTCIQGSDDDVGLVKFLKSCSIFWAVVYVVLGVGLIIGINKQSKTVSIIFISLLMVYLVIFIFLLMLFFTSLFSFLVFPFIFYGIPFIVGGVVFIVLVAES